MVWAYRKRLLETAAELKPDSNEHDDRLGPIRIGPVSKTTVGIEERGTRVQDAPDGQAAIRQKMLIGYGYL